MPVIDFAHFRRFSYCFIETGTGRLASVWAAFAAGFVHVKTVEASEEIYRQNEIDILARGFWLVDAQANWKRFMNEGLVLDVWLGLSVNHLGDMLKGHIFPVVMWLDAHVSGPHSAGHSDWLEKGSASTFARDKVLTLEIQLILAHRKDHILLISDQGAANSEAHIQVLKTANARYQCQVYDEQRGSTLYSNQVLACVVA